MGFDRETQINGKQNCNCNYFYQKFFLFVRFFIFSHKHIYNVRDNKIKRRLKLKLTHKNHSLAKNLL